jgi:gliding motility-associated-like protein
MCSAMSKFSITILCLFGFAVCMAQAEFVENKGQWPNQVAFRASLPAGAIWAEHTAFTWQFFDPSILQYLHPAGGSTPASSIYREHSYRVNFEGCNSTIPIGSKAFSPYYNYYQGADASKWAMHCKAFQRCDYQNIYNNIDLVLYSHNQSVKYDFVLHPNATATSIAMKYAGDVSLSLQNDIVTIRTSVNEITELAPFAYQLVNGKLTEVECHFILENNTLSFEVGTYDHNVDLVIDPEIAFSTFIGSTASNFGFTACDDNEGNLISGANVYSLGYPTTVGAYQVDFNTSPTNQFDAAISKFSNDGTQLLYSTYLGGDHQEAPHSIVADADGNFIVMGVTGSPNFAITAGAYQTTFASGPALNMGAEGFFAGVQNLGTDIFISKFNADGTLLASTFVGGSDIDGLNYADQLFYNYGDAFRGEINVDSNGNVFVASTTRSTNFPTAGAEAAVQETYGGGLSDGVFFKLDASLSTMLWGTYMGGTSADACYAVEFSTVGQIAVAGGTQSGDFPFVQAGDDVSINGEADGFITLFNPTTFAFNGTFAGTAEYDQVYFIQFDTDNNVYCYGQTTGNMGISAGCYGQPNSGQFVRKYNSTVSAINWTTTVGTGSGEIDISPTAFLVSDCNQIYLSGWGGIVNQYCVQAYDCYAQFSTTTGMPTTADAYQSTTDGSDFYLCVLSENAQDLVYGSFLGGNQSAEHVDGGTSRFNKNGSVFQAVCAGCQGNSDFPTTPGVWSANNPSFGCNIAVFRFNLGLVSAIAQIDGPDVVCEGNTVSFINLSSGADGYEWLFGDGTNSTLFEPTHIYEESGDFTITLIGHSTTSCLVGDTTTLNITILPGVNPTVIAPNPVCSGDSTQLFATGTTNLFWLENATLSATNIPNPYATPLVPTTYYVVDFNDCEADTIAVFVDFFTVETDISDNVTICIGDNTLLEASGGVQYSWSPTTGLNSAIVGSPFASPNTTTEYTVEITTADGCVAEENVTVTVLLNAPGGTVFPELEVCLGSSVELPAGDGNTWLWTPPGTLSNANAQHPLATPLSTTTYTVLITNPCGTGTDEVTVNVLVAQIEASEGDTICSGSSVPAWAIGGVQYNWVPPAFANPSNEANTNLSPTESTWFVVQGLDENNCFDKDSLFVYVLPAPIVNAGPDQYYNFPGSAQLFGNTFGLEYYWTPSEGLSCTDCPYPVASPNAPTYYSLWVTDGLGCSAYDSVLVKPYFPLWVPNTITPDNDGVNDVFRAYGESVEGFSLKIFDRWGVKIFETMDIDEPWTGGVSSEYYVQNDTYIWIIEYDTLERRTKLVGHVNVLR